MSRTQRAIVQCGYWLAACLKLGWKRDQLEFLEALWWKYHDDHGRLTKHPRVVTDTEAEAPTP